MNVADTDWAYLAGLIDGEGCIRNHVSGHGHINGNLRVYQRAPEVLQWIVDTFEVGYLRKRPNQELWVYHLQRRFQLKWLLEGVLPYLIVKRKQAELILELIESKGTKYQHKELIGG